MKRKIAILGPYDTVPELPDFDIEFPEGYFDTLIDEHLVELYKNKGNLANYDPEDEDEDPPRTFDPDNLPTEEDNSDGWSKRDNFPYHELDDVTWLH